MPRLMEGPPLSPVNEVTDILHGVAVTDPYRWLEDRNSPNTRAWIDEQTRYARSYLSSFPGRDRIRDRIREFLAVETYDSLQKVGNRYFFRKRLPNQEQPCIYVREGAEGEDQLLVDPAERGTGNFTAVKLLQVSPDGHLLLYEIKEGGERTGKFELLDLENRRVLPDALPRGYLRGLTFGPDNRSFYYSFEPFDERLPSRRVVLRHVLGSAFSEDRQIFSAGDDQNARLFVVSTATRLGILVYRFLDKVYTDFHLGAAEDDRHLEPVLTGAGYRLEPRLLEDRVLALCGKDTPNLRIVELRPQRNGQPRFLEIISETDSRIEQWAVAAGCIVVVYLKEGITDIRGFDITGREVFRIPCATDRTMRFVGISADRSEVFFESQSFLEPVEIARYECRSRALTPFARRHNPLQLANYSHLRVWYPSRDGTRVPMYLVGRRDILASGAHPLIMTSYGGYGVSMTPQFSVFVAVLLERGCVFALPNIRGGSEFGSAWHDAARRQNRQTAYDDFLSAAEWLVRTGRTAPEKMAVFGGSNSGLLVGVAITQRPELFRAAVCMVPLLDMLRYHLFDTASVWKDEFGTADDPEDFAALVKYSPYHRVTKGVSYPAVMLVSGDADQSCNPLHARKMTARLQAANASRYPIVLDYSPLRGHSPVLPLNQRIEALTDRMAFLCDQLELSV